MRSTILALLFVFQGSIHLMAQSTPLAIVEAFFAPEGMSNKHDLYTGEMQSFVNERTMGQYLGPSVSKDIRLLSSSDSTATYAIAVKSGGRIQDWYAFLRRSEGRWRLQAVRTLAETGLVAATLKGLRAMPSRTTEQDWQLRNAELTLSSDADLKTFLQSNLPAFEALVSVVRKGTREAVAIAAKKLFLSSANTAPAGYVELTIGGILDNTVGYLYVPDGVTLPSVTPNEVIYLERIVDHWYVYKTT